MVIVSFLTSIFRNLCIFLKKNIQIFLSHFLLQTKIIGMGRVRINRFGDVEALDDSKAEL